MRVVVGMATTAKRKSFATKAMASLSNQVDKIHLYNNDEHEHDLTDNGKFIGLTLESEPVYYFSCDDDIIYPPDYVQSTIEAIERTKGIVTYHGRELVGLDIDYYKGHNGFICLGEELEDRVLDVGGTGVSAWRTDYFNPIDICYSEDKKMGDLVFSLEAIKQGKKITGIKHSKAWLKDLEVPRKLSIGWTQMVLIAHNKRLFNKDSRQMEIANEIYTIKLNHNK